MDSQPMDISRHVWETKYRHVEQGIEERSITDTWRRVACALAAVEAVDAPAALQPSVDNSISKTISVPEDCPFDEFSRIYDLAYDLQLAAPPSAPIRSPERFSTRAIPASKRLTAARWTERQIRRIR